MENTIIMQDEKNEEWWVRRKKELLEGIHETIENGAVDVEVLRIMKELIKNAKARNSIANYYDEMEDTEV